MWFRGSVVLFFFICNIQQPVWNLGVKMSYQVKWNITNVAPLEVCFAHTLCDNQCLLVEMCLNGFSDKNSNGKKKMSRTTTMSRTPEWSLHIWFDRVCAAYVHHWTCSPKTCDWNNACSHSRWGIFQSSSLERHDRRHITELKQPQSTTHTTLFILTAKLWIS